MKRKKLEEILQDVDTFENPKAILEQYPTNPHIASHMLFTANELGDIEGKIVCDLGIGCGILSIGAAILGAEYQYGIDVDEDAIGHSQQNLDQFEISTVDLITANVERLLVNNKFNRFFADTVVMNPPFGTKNKGIDSIFLDLASKIAQTAIYSLHKFTTRDYIIKRAESLGFNAKVIAELKYDIPKTYKFHKKENAVVRVDFIRFLRK